MSNFKIAIIDSGIDTSHPRLSACKTSGVSFVNTKTGIIEAREYHDEQGHGTAIAAIIHKSLPDMELVGVKLSSQIGVINENLLCEGLRWCLSRFDIRVINISLGVAAANPHPELYDLCNEAKDRGIFICASSHNMPGYECYPAYFPSVLGVTSGFVKNKNQFGFVEGDNAINIIAKGTTQRLAWANKGYKISSGNSFATAHFSAILASFLLENPQISYEGIIRLLKENADKNVREMQYIGKAESFFIPREKPKEEDKNRLFHLPSTLDFVSKIALFPVCEKEMGTILAFREHCPFEITKLFDYPRRFSFRNSKLFEQQKITTIIDENDFESFDTLIVGYFFDQMFDANIVFGYDMIEMAIKKNKNIITWDVNVYKYIRKRCAAEVNKHYAGTVWIPAIEQEMFERVMNFRYLPSVDAPTILVTGTSNKQGKITTQMRLKSILEQEGYKISHLSTEPQGVLLGADFVFPYGHNDTIYLNEDLWGVFLSAVMKGMAQVNKPHILITGTQGKLLPRSTSPVEVSAQGALSSLHFVCGISPDAVICAINPQDTFEQIRNVILSLKIFTNSKLLFFVITPHKREFIPATDTRTVFSHTMLASDELTEYRNKFQSEFHLPVIDIMDRNNDKWILDTIEETFSKKSVECWNSKI